MLEQGTKEQRSIIKDLVVPQAFDLSLNEYSCRIVQALIGKLPSQD